MPRGLLGSSFRERLSLPGLVALQWQASSQGKCRGIYTQLGLYILSEPHALPDDGVPAHAQPHPARASAHELKRLIMALTSVAGSGAASWQSHCTCWNIRKPACVSATSVYHLST